MADNVFTSIEATSVQATSGLYVGASGSPIEAISSTGDFKGYIPSGTPVAQVQAEGTLTFTDVVVNGETVTIGTDVFEIHDTEGSIGAGNNWVDISGGTKAQATNTILIAGAMSEGETISIGTDVYEIDTDGVVASGNIAIDVSGSQTKASGTITITGVPTAGGYITITLADASTKVFEFVTSGDPTGTNIGVNIANATTADEVAYILASMIDNEDELEASRTSSGVVTVTDRFGGTSGNSITVVDTEDGAETYIACTSPLSSGADSSASQIATALDAAITASGTEAVDNSLDTATVTITATAAGEYDGSAGNVFALATDSANVTLGGSTLTGGSDATAVEAVAALIVAISGGSFTFSGAEGDTTSKLDVTNTAYGTVGNSVATTTTCANAAWGDTVLSGGVDGSSGTAREMKVDASYLYICTTTCTDGTGWKKVSLSSL